MNLENCRYFGLRHTAVKGRAYMLRQKLASGGWFITSGLEAKNSYSLWLADFGLSVDRGG